MAGQRDGETAPAATPLIAAIILVEVAASGASGARVAGQQRDRVASIPAMMNVSPDHFCQSLEFRVAVNPECLPSRLQPPARCRLLETDVIAPASQTNR
jgi:hypothetical protein